jgi:hypothetical protein
MYKRQIMCQELSGECQLPSAERGTWNNLPRTTEQRGPGGRCRLKRKLQIAPNYSRLVQITQDWSRLLKIGPDYSRLVQIAAAAR